MINSDSVNREKLLFAYNSALEQGNFARVETILEMAQSDPILERQIVEMNATLSQKQEGTTAAAAPESLIARLWERIRASAASRFSRPNRLRTSLGILGGVLGTVIVVLVALALLGPAIGKIFSNVVTALPSSAYPQTYSVAATQTAQRQMDSFGAYPAPAVIPASGSKPASQPADRLIVRNGKLIVMVEDTRQARQAIMAMIAEFAAEGAYVVSVNETYPSYTGQMPVISMALRVPVQRYDECMTRITNLGPQVLGRIETAQDVTQDYVDTTARIEALQTSRARLLEIIQNAKNTDDLLRAEQELSKREAELEAMKAKQQNLEKTAALSSISVDLRPTVTSQPVASNVWDPAVTFHNAASALVRSLRSLADGIIYFGIAILPWLAVAGLLIYGFVRLFRRRKKNP